jgi:hypothetical protein
MLTSTVWSESDSTRIVFVTMLLMADKNGEVLGSIPGIARFAGVSVDSCSAAIERLSSPDKYSSSKLADGRRIVAINGGWELVNHAKYREMASKEDSQHSAAERKRRQREREEAVTRCHGDVTHGHGDVTGCHGESRSVTENRDIADVPPPSEPFLNTFAPDKPSRAENENTDSLPVFSLSGAGDGTSIAQAPEKPVIATEGGKEGHSAEKPKPQKRERPRNPLLDALVALDGTLLEQATGPAFSKAAKALKEIREVCPCVTDEQIRAAAKRYREKWPSVTCSATAIAKHWGALQEGQRKDFNAGITILNAK